MKKQMKRQQQQQPHCTVSAPIVLDQEVIADLGATDCELDAIRGGGRRTSGCLAATNAG